MGAAGGCNCWKSNPPSKDCEISISFSDVFCGASSGEESSGSRSAIRGGGEGLSCARDIRKAKTDGGSARDIHVTHMSSHKFRGGIVDTHHRPLTRPSPEYPPQ